MILNHINGDLKTMSSTIKILRCKLVNFIGIHMGTGKKELELKFNNKETKVLILGRNGSSKSVIMACLTPFAETFDDYRDKLILDDEDGLKEIDIQKDNFIFKISHHYGKRNKSYIKKYDLNDNLIEDLNPIGNISLFPAVVKEHLGVTKDFFAICKLGSRAENFIDFKASKRKEYLGHFTPNIDEYLSAYKTVTSKLNVISKEAKFVSDEFDKLGKEEDIQIEISTLTKTLKGHRKLVSTYQLELEKVQDRLESSSEKTKLIVDLQNTITEHTKKIDILTTKAEELDESLNRGFSKRDFDYDKITELKKTLQTRTIEIQESIVSQEASMRAYLEQVASLETDLSKAQKTRKQLLSTIGNDVDTSEIESLQKYLEETINPALEKIYAVIEKQEIYDISSADLIDDTQEASAIITEIVESGDILINKQNLLGNIETFLNLHRPDIPCVSDITLSEGIRNILKYSIDDEDLLDLENDIQKHTSEISRLQTMDGAFTTVYRVAKLCACKSSCDLHRKLEASANNDTSEVDDLRTKIAELKKSLSEGNHYKDLKKSITNAITRFDKYLKDPLFSELFPSKINRNEYTLFTLTMDEIHVARSELIEESKFINAVKNLSNLRITYLKTKLQLSQFDNIGDEVKIQDAMISSISLSITDIRKKNESSELEISELYRRKAVVEKSLIGTIKMLEFLDIIIEHENVINNIEKELDVHRTFIHKIDADKAITEEIRHNLVVTEKAIESSQVRLDDLRVSLTRIAEYSTRLERLQNDKTRLQVIKDSLDIKTGIPLVLVGDYLSDIKKFANQLLGIAFKGRFIIDFQTSDKEFSIPVYENGKQPRRDVKECSQGEQALIKTVVSLAIVLQAFKLSGFDYNILYLDEVDSELDEDNRQYFLDMVDKLISKLGCEQCFIITHNQFFHSSEAGIIAMNGSRLDRNDEAFWQNKTLIHSEE